MLLSEFYEPLQPITLILGEELWYFSFIGSQVAEQVTAWPEAGLYCGDSWIYRLLGESCHPVASDAISWWTVWALIGFWHSAVVLTVPGGSVMYHLPPSKLSIRTQFPCNVNIHFPQVLFHISTCSISGTSVMLFPLLAKYLLVFIKITMSLRMICS